MKGLFERKVESLNRQADEILREYFKTEPKPEPTRISLPPGFEEEFFSLVDQVNLSLMEDREGFYGFFLMQMSRVIRFDITSPTAVTFKGANYILAFNPMIFLELNLKQMESTIKHEILHVISLHLIRARELRKSYSTQAVNMAMNIVVNMYLDYLPPYSVTLEWVNVNYSLKLLPFKPLEYYAEELQKVLNLLDADAEEEDEEDDQEWEHDEEQEHHEKQEYDEEREHDEEPEHKKDEALCSIETEYHPETDHALWSEAEDADEKTVREFTEKYIVASQKGALPNYLEGIISALKRSGGELPWNMYLKRLMGTMESGKKKTITRKSRRQPDRLDLRGELRDHKARIAVALDISGSISDLEFNSALKEVLEIVKNHSHIITILECDSEIRRIYKVKTSRDIRERLPMRGSTRFSPVFDYANRNKIDLLIYFTDGKGEEKLAFPPRGYKTLWVISGRGEQLSLKEAYGSVKKLQADLPEEGYLDMTDVKQEGFSMNDQERSPF